MKLRKYQLNPQNNKFDYHLLINVVILVVFGLVMVYDASVVHALKDFGDPYYYIRQQTLWVIAGIFSAVVFAGIDYHFFKKIALPMMCISLLLLSLVFVPSFGVSVGGAKRWLNLGFMAIQPAEIVKLAGVIYLATVFEKKARVFPVMILTAVIIVIMAVLQKDLGSTIVFVATAAAIYYVSGGALWQFIVLGPLAIGSFLVLALTSEYRRNRLLAFLDPFSDPLGYTYHIGQVLIALGSGGLLGLGLGQSRQKFEYIPEVTTDSIFAIIGEELGLIGGILVVGLFVYFAMKGFKIASEAKDDFGRILATGLTCWIVIQAIINLSSMVALMPLTGVPLPFISYGGSALIANLTSVGILLNISKSR